MEKIQCDGLFSPDNTEWETYQDEYGYYQELIYCGSLEELAKEKNLPEDKVFELFFEYQDCSKDLVEERLEIERERRMFQ